MHCGHHLASMASSIAFCTVFVFLTFLLFFIREVQLSEETLIERQSKTWKGPCQVIFTEKCNQQCREQEHAFHGACHFRFPTFACFCYFKKEQHAGANICRRRSKTWTGACPIITKNKPCNKQCREWEYALSGGCHFQFPGFACFCYFNC